MRTLRTLSVLLLAAVSTLVAQTTTNPIVSYAYVGTQAGKIYGYAVYQNGASSALAGSPYLGPSEAVASTTHFLYGHDNNNIVTYQRSSSGALHAVSTINGVAHNNTPQTSGVGALTLDRTGASLYAGEVDFDGTDNGGYAEFHKTSTGALQWFANAGTNVNYGGFLQFSHDNKFAYGTGCYFLGWQIFGFYRASDGTLTSFDTGSSFPPNPNGDYLCPGAIATSARGYLAVAYDFINPTVPTTTKIAIYQITSSGAIRYLTTRSTPFNGIGALRFDPSGNFLAAGGKGIETYRLNSDATLTKVSGPIDTGTPFKSFQWDNAWHVLAVSDYHFYVFKARYGLLSQAGTPHPTALTTNVTAVPLQ